MCFGEDSEHCMVLRKTLGGRGTAPSAERSEDQARVAIQRIFPLTCVLGSLRAGGTCKRYRHVTKLDSRELYFPDVILPRAGSIWIRVAFSGRSNSRVTVARRRHRRRAWGITNRAMETNERCKKWRCAGFKVVVSEIAR